MLPKHRRLYSREVREVLKDGRSYRSTYLLMKFLASGEPLKISAVVPKKGVSLAVERNRIRRAVYRAITPLKGRGKAVIFVQKIPKEDLAKVFANDIAVLFKKISI